MTAIWRVWCLCMWFGVMFAVCAVVIAVALCAFLVAVLYGLVSSSRTPKSTLAALYANSAEGIARIVALRPQGQNKSSP